METLLGFPLKAKVHEPLAGCVLVTGAGAGIGANVAQRLASEGYTVYAGMPSLSPSISGHPCNFIPVQLDVASESQILAAAARIASSRIPLVAVINCAGIPSSASPMELVATGEMTRVLDVNAVGPLRVVQACLPLLRRSRGRVVNVSSVAGFSPSPMHGVYAASTVALETWSDALRVEVRKWGISVAVVQPGSVDSGHHHGSHRRASMDASSLPADNGTVVAMPPPRPDGIYAPLHSSVARVAMETRKHLLSTMHTSRAIVHAVKDQYPKTRYLVGFDARLSKLLSFLPDRVLDWAFWIALGRER
ncbi:hypothetical protein HKX48_000850 [Thoreauomyces humboldtii]|nr:hypothetical protein HKX48_000850 [Thoreauomyces humboldtii]